MDSIVLDSPSALVSNPSAVGFKSKVCRVLFGPIDHKLTREFLRHEWSEILVKSSRQWDFDFSRDVPMRNGGKFSWERVEVTKTAARRKWTTADGKSSVARKKREGRKQSKCLSLLQSTIKDYMPVEKRPTLRKSKGRALPERRKKFGRKPRLYTDKLRRK